IDSERFMPIDVLIVARNMMAQIGTEGEIVPLVCISTESNMERRLVCEILNDRFIIWAVATTLLIPRELPCGWMVSSRKQWLELILKQHNGASANGQSSNKSPGRAA